MTSDTATPDGFQHNPRDVKRIHDLEVSHARLLRAFTAYMGERDKGQAYMDQDIEIETRAAIKAAKGVTT